MGRAFHWFRIVALGCCTCACAGAALAADWPQWRGPQRSGHVPPGVVVPETLPAAPKVLWQIPIGYGLASPVVAGGKIVYLDIQSGKEVVHAADALTGKDAWAVELDEGFKDNQTPMGPRCTPVIDGGLLYAQSCRGELKCLALADGRVVWRTNFVKDLGATFIGEKGSAEGASRHGFNAPPLMDGDRLIALVGGKPGAAVVCFDKRTGNVVWKAREGTPAYSAPVIAQIAGVRQLVAFMADGVMSLDPADGRLLWRLPIKTAFGRHVMAPVVVGDMVVVSSHQVGLIGIRVAKDGNALKAEKAWTSKESAVNFMSPVAVGQHLYGVGPRKNLICVDVMSGRQAWSQDGLLAGSANNAHAGIIAMGEKLLVLTDRGELVLIPADPKEYREIARAAVCGQNWCNPAYADGKVYLRDAGELRCVEVVGAK
jgi:outer membrane protein assembly factor BamB